MKNTERAGGTRFSEGKIGGWAYVPMFGMHLIAKVAEMGAEKYAPQDWRAGQSYSTLWNSFMRHVLKAQEYGLHARDDESGLLHLAHAGWNLLALLTFMAQGRHELDDVDVWRGITTAQKREAEEYAEREGVPLEEAVYALHYIGVELEPVEEEDVDPKSNAFLGLERAQETTHPDLEE